MRFFTFDPSTGKSIPNVALFRDKKMLLWAKNSEPNIVLKQSINATGLM
jgi:hypothetical protein